MIQALSIASGGMFSAQKRAADVAVDIVTSAANRNALPANTPQNQSENKQPQTPPSSIMPINGKNGVLVQQIVELKQAELQFKASASTFKRIAETARQLLGSFVDDES